MRGKLVFSRRIFLGVSLAAAVWGNGALAQSSSSGPLPSWNAGATKQAIVGFVERVTREGGPDYVKPAERIATFDNNGTLRAEQPVYFQFACAFDRVQAQPPHNPQLSK